MSYQNVSECILKIIELVPAEDRIQLLFHCADRAHNQMVDELQSKQSAFAITNDESQNLEREVHDLSKAVNRGSQMLASRNHSKEPVSNTPA